MRYLKICASGSFALFAVLSAFAQQCAGDADCDGIPDSVEQALKLDPAYKDNDVFANSRLFVMQQYRDALSREGDLPGIEGWRRVLDRNQSTTAQVAAAFAASPEISQRFIPLVRLYRVYFERFADEPGIRYWERRLASGETLEQLTEIFAQSPEFVAKYGPLTNDAFVELVYRNTLGRAPDAAGKANWLQQLTSGAITRGSLMLRFATSAEYAAKTAEEVQINVAYFSALRRAPSQADYNASLAQIRTGGLAAVFAPIIASGEYRDRFLKLQLGNLASLGPPSATRVNGLLTVQDTAHRVARHALSARYEPDPNGDALPVIGQIRTLTRRDSTVIYVPNVAGAADYRVRVSQGPSMTLVALPTVWACAGFRQRAWQSLEDSTGFASRELLQAIELPGLIDQGPYVITVEAIDTPCPFAGVPGHTSATIPMLQSRLQALTGGTVPIASSAATIARYGADYINGHAASSDWLIAAGQKRGQLAPVQTIKVIARASIRISVPAFDEDDNAPIIDTGANSVFDDFRAAGLGAASFDRIPNRSFGGSDAIQGPFGNWYFWGTSAQAAVGQTGTAQPLGVQVWQQHGRLNITHADWAQDVFTATHFSSLRAKPSAVDAQKYVHSFFRVDSGATGRRYWHWMMCGAQDQVTLVDANSVPRIRHLLRPAFYDYSNGNPVIGVNPTQPPDGEALTAFHRRECIQLLQLSASNPDTPTLPNGQPGPLPNQTLLAVINPEGQANGVINLAPTQFDRGYGAPAQTYRLDAAGKYAGPLFEPFDQQQPLTHFDVFVRSDRMVLFINGRQAACWNMTDRPLTMKFGHIVYGQVLYHSDAEYDEQFYPRAQRTPFYRPPMGSHYYSLNPVAADHRAWDAVGHSEKLDIPDLFAFDEATCFKPKTVAVK